MVNLKIPMIELIGQSNKFFLVKSCLHNAPKIENEFV